MPLGQFTSVTHSNALAARNNEAYGLGLGKVYRRVGITDVVHLACEIREKKKEKKKRDLNCLYVNGTSSLTASVLPVLFCHSSSHKPIKEI